MADDTGRIRILLVDDHQVVRRGLRTFLEVQEDIEVVGAIGSGLALLVLTVGLAALAHLMVILFRDADPAWDLSV
ncbi:hypothetical protein ACFXJJ_38365, partial [Streptomyces sp. NPDC059233]